MKTKFTEKQQQAIDLREKNILVSAAAGSGKTAVLVERIIKLISEGERPLDIDRLLIVTFTNAAAGEMRERIIAAIGEKLVQEPENEHLQRQSALIHNAQITTIHSFCLFVIRNHFQEIGLDPAFRVADENEMSLLRQDVLKEVLEEAFVELEESETGEGLPFRRLVESFSTGKKETVLEESILSLYRFAMSYPWPKEWLTEHGKDYEFDSAEELQKASFIQYAVDYLKNMLPELEEQLRDCIRICEEPDGPYMYGENIEKSLNGLKRAVLAESFFEIGDRLSGIGFDRLSAKKDDSVNLEKRESVKNVRNHVKKQLEQLRDQFFSLGEEAVLRQCKQVSPIVRKLTELVIVFMERMSEKKREKNLIDFSDMEHLALNILCRRKEEGSRISVEPTAAALELRDYFQEILIDEYQDSNLVQECILSCISGEDTKHYNRFMVGDVKQSIYKFRLARPELFMEKFYTYSETKGPCRLIDLYQNFRSRREVIDSVNLIFSQLFSRNLGEIEYDGRSNLHYGAVYYDAQEEIQETEEGSAESGNITEFLLIEKQEDTEKSVIEQEAEVTADRIKRLMRENKVLDRISGALRPVRYGDIVILLRSSSGIDEVFQEVLGKQDIPCYISSKTGYFQTSEIQVLLQLLRVLDNPLQDIPLFGVLKSCFGGFRDEELAAIAAAFPGKRKLYKKMERYAKEEGTDRELREKCRIFLDWYKQLRSFTVWLSVRELLEKITEENHYLEYVTAMPGGEQRRANVEMLLQKAAAFETTSFKGLYHFVRYMDQMEKYSIDSGEAATLDESSDVVRIMTVHKSKGLEFPICFVAGTGRKMNRKDASEAVLTDMDMGIAVDLTEPEMRLRQKTLRKAVMAQKIRLDSQAEELRILYVALTRAKEKLIITGLTDNIEKELKQSLIFAQRKETVLPYSVRSRASEFLELITASLIRTKGMQDLLKEYHLELSASDVIFQENILCKAVTAEKMQSEQAERENKMINNAEAFRIRLETGAVNNALKEKMEDRFGFGYPYANLQKLYAKTTVSELKMAAIRSMSGQLLSGLPGEEEEDGKHLFEGETVVPYLPAFLKEDEKEGKISGAMRGSAMHRVMELIDFAKWEENELKKLEADIQKWCAEGLLSGEYARAVNREKILHFMETPLAKRMKKADRIGALSKEQPFMLGIGADRLSEDFPASEQVLIQGIIDVFFEEDGEIVLMDYKTDVIHTPGELADRYRVQLDYYAEALTRITKKKVKERILYSFYLEEEIPV